MATFLEICKDTARECDISGDGPAGVQNQTGLDADVVRWVKKSYVEIQNRHNGHWRWLRHGFTINTVADQDTYTFSEANDDETGTAITRFSSWRLRDVEDPPKIYLTSSGKTTENWMIWSNWTWFKQIYRIVIYQSSYPAHITVDPLDRVVLGPPPNDDYTVSGDYYLSAQILAEDDDVPEMPSQFHDLIMWYAIENYGYREAAPEVLTRARKKMRSFMRQLEANQLERPRKARALA